MVLIFYCFPINVIVLSISGFDLLKTNTPSDPVDFFRNYTKLTMATIKALRVEEPNNFSKKGPPVRTEHGTSWNPI